MAEKAFLRNEQFLFQVLMKWGEYSSEVQLILRKSPESNKLTAPSSSRSLHGNRLNSASDSPTENIGNNNIYEENTKGSTIPVLDMDEVQALDRNRDTRKSLTFGGLHGNVPEHSEVIKNQSFNCLITWNVTFIQKVNIFSDTNGKCRHCSTDSAEQV